MIDGQEYQMWTNAVLEHTEAGRITDWTERIAQLAKKIGLKVHFINWNGSPIDVASKVVEAAHAQNKMDLLKKELEK